VACCPSCGRPVARAGPRCLYCSAPLPAREEPPPPAAALEPPPTTLARRLLVVLDLDSAEPSRLERALPLGRFEAELLARRGGFHLHRLADVETARGLAQRLAEDGVRVVLVPEAEARTPPLRALSGEWAPPGLMLRTETGPLGLAPGSLQLVVTGEVVREYEPRHRGEATRAGQRFIVHLHRRGETAAVEIDSAILGVGGSLTGSARLSVETWIESLAEDAPRDDRFRLLSPALSPAEPDPAQSAVAVAAALGEAKSAGGREPRQLLDNLAQFRFYSGWRGAVERRRGTPG